MPLKTTRDCTNNKRKMTFYTRARIHIDAMVKLRRRHRRTVTMPKTWLPIDTTVRYCASHTRIIHVFIIVFVCIVCTSIICALVKKNAGLGWLNFFHHSRSPLPSSFSVSLNPILSLSTCITRTCTHIIIRRYTNMCDDVRASVRRS